MSAAAVPRRERSSRREGAQRQGCSNELKANYFKLGLFVVGAVIAGVIVIVVIGSGRWFQPRVSIETYFNESVQGLDVGSKLKYRGVVIGEVTRIGFTYNKYQQDRPMQQRARYVLVEAQIQPRLLGGRAGGGDLTEQKAADLEIERGLRMRLAPQGITGTSYLEIDYVEPAPSVLPIDWVPTTIYIPSAPSTVTTVVNAAIDILTRLHNIDIEGTLAKLDTLLVTTNEKVAAIDTRIISQRADRVLAKMETSLDNLATKQLSDQGARTAHRAPRDHRRAQEDGVEPGAAEAAGRHGGGNRAGARDSRRPQRQRITHASVTDADADRPHHRRWRGRPVRDFREPAPDHRQPARSHRRQQTLSCQHHLRRAAETAGEHPMTPPFPSHRPPWARAFAVVAMALFASALVACSLSRPSVARRTFLLEPTPPSTASVQKLVSLRVGLVNVAAPYRGKAFVYRQSELKFEADFYSEFFVAPAAMLSEATARALSSANVFRRTDPPGAGDSGDYVLDGFASELYGDLRDPAKPLAAVAITYYLSPSNALSPNVDLDAGIPAADACRRGHARCVRPRVERRVVGDPRRPRARPCGDGPAEVARGVRSSRQPGLEQPLPVMLEVGARSCSEAWQHRH